MRKIKSGLLKKPSVASANIVSPYIKKSILFTGGCFSFFAVFTQSFDTRILMDLQEDRTKGTTQVHKFISNTTNPTCAAIPLTVLAVGIISNDKTTVQKGLYLTETLVLSTAITYTLKATIQRPRPATHEKNLTVLGNEKSYSFPSGHTSSAFATATSLTITFPKWYIIAPAYLWAGSVAYSRMYLGAHYPSDVIAGAIVGSGSALLTKKVNDWLHKKKKVHVNEKLLN